MQRCWVGAYLSCPSAAVKHILGAFAWRAPRTPVRTHPTTYNTVPAPCPITWPRVPRAEVRPVRNGVVFAPRPPWRPLGALGGMGHPVVYLRSPWRRGVLNPKRVLRVPGGGWLGVVVCSWEGSMGSPNRRQLWSWWQRKGRASVCGPARSNFHFASRLSGWLFLSSGDKKLPGLPAVCNRAVTTQDCGVSGVDAREARFLTECLSEGFARQAFGWWRSTR